MIFITRAAFVASCFRGVLPPVDFRAVCFVSAIATRLTVCIALENRFKGKSIQSGQTANDSSC